MSRILRLRHVVLVTVVAIGAFALADAIGIGATAEARPASIRDCGVVPGPSWSTAGESGTGWHFVATSTVPCSERVGFVRQLAPRLVSSGTVDVVRFLYGSWACFAQRSSVLGFCMTGSGSAGRIVFVVPASRVGAALVDAFVSDGGAAIVGPIVGVGSGGSGLPELDDEPSALRPTACTARRGSVWSSSAPEGNLWLAYAGGGITCLAAQGWIVDVSARMPAGLQPVEFDGGDSWRCIAGPNASRQGTRVGACARRNNWRRSLEARSVVVAGGVPPAVRARLLTYGYDAAIWEIAGVAPASFALPAICSYKGTNWRVGGSSGNRWIVGTAGGYPCAVASSAATLLVGRTENATRDQSAGKGVRGAWRCRFTAATRTTACTWAGVPLVATRRALKVVFTPDRAGGRAIVDAALARLG